MAIRIGYSPGFEEKIEFNYSPFWELMFSLHVLCNAKHHGLHLQWAVQTKRRMDRKMLADLRYFGKGFREYLSIVDLIILHPELELRSFDEEMREVEGLSELEFAHRILRDTCSRAEVRQALKDGEALGSCLERFQEEPVSKAERAGSGHACSTTCQRGAVRDLLTDTSGFRERLVAFVRRYWDEIFRLEFERLEFWFLSDITEKARVLRVSDAPSLMAQLSERTGFDRESSELLIRVNLEDSIDGDALNALTISPTYFGAPHLILTVDPGHVALCYDLVTSGSRKTPRIPPARLVSMMRAAGDEVRLTILKLLAEKRRSTQELAEILLITPPSVSRHLRILREASLVTSEGEGYYVFYSLVRDEVASLGRHLGEYIGGDVARAREEEGQLAGLMRLD